MSAKNFWSPLAKALFFGFPELGSKSASQNDNVMYGVKLGALGR